MKMPLSAVGSIIESPSDMSSRSERALSVILTLAACVIALVLVRREFFPSARVAASAALQPPRYQEGWEEWVDDGILIGNRQATVKVVEFSDLECPYCARFSSRWDELRTELRDSVALVFVHFPLTETHRFAMPAARSAECAAQQGRVEDYLRLVFKKQDSLGLKSWVSYAKEAGVSDTASFALCSSSIAPVPRIDRGLARGKALGIHATPAIMIDGFLYDRMPNDSVFSSAVRAAVRKRL